MKCIRQFVTTDMLVVAFATLVVIADYPFTSDDIDQSILEWMLRWRNRFRYAPNHDFYKTLGVFFFDVSVLSLRG